MKKIIIYIYSWFICIYSLTVFLFIFRKLSILYLKMQQFGEALCWLANHFKQDSIFWKEMINLMLWGFRQLENNIFSIGGGGKKSMLVFSDKNLRSLSLEPGEAYWLTVPPHLPTDGDSYQERRGIKLEKKKRNKSTLSSSASSSAVQQKRCAGVLVSMAARLCLPPVTSNNT